MASFARQSVAPLYLFLCLILGGSAQGIWTNALLQLLGLAIIAWTAGHSIEERPGKAERQLVLIVLAALVTVALQVVPLPPSVWPRLGGREALAQGFAVLGLPVPARPLSLAPYDTLSTLLSLIPALALFCAISRAKAYRAEWLVLAALAAAILGIVLGALQVASPEPRTSPWYLYPQSSFGLAAGFFANANNMAMLLVVCLPFLAALVASPGSAGARRYPAVAAIAAGAALVLIVGIALIGSLAGYGLALPVLIASSLLLIRGRRTLRRGTAAATAVLLAGALAALAVSPVRERGLDASASVLSRVEIMSTSTEAAKDFLPFGSGLGTFREVYQLYEDHDAITRTHVNHAHNDYLELVIELGVPGIMLILAFLGWWAIASWRAWRYADAAPYARAASIASAALLAHSLVEFPLRTAALSGFFAMCLALLIERRRPNENELEDLRPTRHLELR